jgi:hypothetical protein
MYSIGVTEMFEFNRHPFAADPDSFDTVDLVFELGGADQPTARNE